MITRLYEYDLFGHIMHTVEIPVLFNEPRRNKYDYSDRAREEREQFVRDNCPSRYGVEGKLISHDNSHTGLPHWSVMFFDADDAMLFYLRYGHIGEPSKWAL